MAFGFTREGQVLNFKPRRPVEHRKRISFEYILWPAWSYRVVAPRFRKRQLNMFQKAALGLCRARQQDVASIAETLAIHPDLAAFILVELVNYGYVDGDGLATDRGIRALDEDAFDIHDMVAGYVFQDPWNGDLWPRFVEQLDYCDLEQDESGFPSLMFGTTGKPLRRRSFMVLPQSISSPAQPAPAKVISAVAGHRKAIRYADNLEEWDDDFGQTGSVASPVHIDRVSFVEEEPAPVYLMTYLYVAEGWSHGGEWHACDPFGLGASLRLRRRVEHVMREVPALYNVVDRLVGRCVRNGLEEHRRWMEQLRAKAELEVEKRLTVNARTYAAFDRIFEMEVARQEALLLGRDCPPSKIEVALRSCLKCLEAVFGDLATRYPLGDVWKRVYVSRTHPRHGTRLVQQQDRAWLAETYRAAANAVGFADPLPESLVNIRPGHIRSVAEYGEQWRLRPLVMACVLAAQTDPDHPLRVAAGRSSELLQNIEDVARQGGQAGHADGEAGNIENLESKVELTYIIISNLSGLGTKVDSSPVR